MDEREDITHHLMDFLPLDQEYSVIDFKADALDLVRPSMVEGAHEGVNTWNESHGLSSFPL